MKPNQVVRKFIENLMGVEKGKTKIKMTLWCSGYYYCTTFFYKA